MPRPKTRSYRTRKDPFAEVWESHILPVLKRAPGLDAITILRHLQEQNPEHYPDSQLRTLQRRVKHWRALEGPEQEVMFPQNKYPGKVGILDFTFANELEVTIGGEHLDHRLFHFRLPYSGWHWSTVVLGGESYTALAEGVEAALNMVGGAPEELRTDSLSAAWKNKEEKDEMTRLFDQLCDHYGMEGTHNNKGKGHENGWIESPHGHLKHQISQLLMLRGSRDFRNLEDYREWVQNVHKSNNRRLDGRFAEEQKHLHPLPKHLAITWKPGLVTVTPYCTVNIDRVMYTVPSRLKKNKLNVHLFDDRIELFLSDGTFVHAMERVRNEDRNKRSRSIDYRHVIHSLVRKPGALPGLVYLDELHPSPVWRRAWMALREFHSERQASRTYLGLLLIAHQHCCEGAMTIQLDRDLSSSILPDLEVYRECFQPKPESCPAGPEFDEVDVSTYDQALLSNNYSEEYNIDDAELREPMAGG